LAERNFQFRYYSYTRSQVRPRACDQARLAHRQLLTGVLNEFGQPELADLVFAARDFATVTNTTTLPNHNPIVAMKFSIG